MGEIRVFQQNKITLYEFYMMYEDIDFLKEIYDPQFDLTDPMIQVKVEPFLNTADNTIIITYYFGFNLRGKVIEIESEKYFGDSNHIKSYVERYVTSHYLKHQENFEWQMKKLVHSIMMSALPEYDPEWEDRTGMYHDFSDNDKAETQRDFWDDFVREKLAYKK